VEEAAAIVSPPKEKRASASKSNQWTLRWRGSWLSNSSMSCPHSRGAGAKLRMWWLPRAKPRKPPSRPVPYSNILLSSMGMLSNLSPALVNNCFYATTFAMILNYLLVIRFYPIFNSSNKKKLADIFL